MGGERTPAVYYEVDEKRQAVCNLNTFPRYSFSISRNRRVCTRLTGISVPFLSSMRS